MFVDIHVIQTVPPSNLNRDDTGSPKSAYYGGVRRARASSQAWKRATRAGFADSLQESDLGVRTKRIVDAIVEIARADGSTLPESEIAKRATEALSLVSLKAKQPPAKKKSPGDSDAATEPKGFGVTDYLVFYSRAQIARLAELVASGAKLTKSEVANALESQHGIEVALFGRMVADNKDLSVDASVQVAHALSTHAVDDESDYFTAVDDRGRDDDMGADMLGTIEFNSSTFYRYATINVAGLSHNLDGHVEDVTRAVEAFVRDFSRSMPTGKQNTFANRTVPDVVAVMVRSDQPVNLVGAFESAVVTRGTDGRVTESVRRLVEQAEAVTKFVDSPIASFVIFAGGRTAEAASLGVECSSLTDLASKVRHTVGHGLRAASS